ncbi:hypothetical protein ACFE04_012710 [Oxalis oulophora]
MGTLVPIIDLNLSPDRTTTAVAASSTSTVGTNLFKTPKIEPRDEAPGFSTAVQPPLPSSQPPPPRPPSQLQLQASTSGTAANHTDVVSSIDPDSHLYSEFSRVSELFRDAFAQRLNSQFVNDERMLDADAAALVPMPDDNGVMGQPMPRSNIKPRSTELVRVSDMSPFEQRHFREVVRQTRKIYDSLRVCKVFDFMKMSGGKRGRADLDAANLMKRRALWLNRDKRIVGPIPGVEVGDIFFFRMELCVIGLHGHAQAGIDYLPGTQSTNGEPIATSIIVSGGYEDDEDKGEEITYTGQGGQDKHRVTRQCAHQKLETGNLALERSRHYGIEVRVIRGFKYEGVVSSKVYVYDGLYRIVDCWFDVGKSGFGVYKYKLVRIEGQQEMGTTILKFAETLRVKPLSVRPKGYITSDISRKKESMPIMLFNDIDNDALPVYFEYLATTVFPPSVFDQGNNGRGCDCTGGCGEDCSCAMKNGGEFAYDPNGVLLRGKPVIFECGPFCKCSQHCQNRVSQQGLRNRLEVFRSRETGWGVRSLDLIHAGSFICEYAGVVLTKEQAEIFAMNGDNLVYPSKFSDKWAAWGDLSEVFPDYVRPSFPSIPPLDFAMDVSRMRNVASYMSHSPTPNVMVQFVMYDHNNLMFPHLMLFAMENIPPLRELSLDYGLTDELIKPKEESLAICN